MDRILLSKKEVDDIIIETMREMYDSGETPPFYMSDVQKRIGNKHQHIRDTHWTDRMQRHCFRLADAGKLIMLKKGSRYYLALPDSEIDEDFKVLTKREVPDYRAKFRKPVYEQICEENPDVVESIKKFDEYWVTRKLEFWDKWRSGNQTLDRGFAREKKMLDDTEKDDTKKLFDGFRDRIDKYKIENDVDLGTDDVVMFGIRRCSRVRNED